MKLTGGEIVVRALEDEGIRHAFGIPGTHNIELYDALGAAGKIRPVLVTHEQSASFAADGYWRASGRMACVNVVPGAGLTHALSGIAEAYLDNVPMLVLGCGIRRDTGASFQLHDVDQQALAEPVTKATFLPLEGGELYGVIRKASRIARSGPPGPVFVEVPANLYMFKHQVELAEPDPPSDEPPGPPARELARAAELLRKARRPLLYAGAGCVEAYELVRRLAETLEAPVSTTFQGKGIFPEGHPLFLWPGFGEAAPPFVRDLVKTCDATLAVGCRFSEVGTGSYGLEPPAPLIHVDVDPSVPGRNYPAELEVASDAGLFLEGLLEALGDPGREPDRELRDAIGRGHASVRDEWSSEIGGEGVTPAHLLGCLQRRLGPEAVYATDSGNGTFLAMECLRLEAPRKFLAPVDYSCMGYSVPAALGAKLARPEAPVAALVGDGAFLMTGLEFLTSVREGAGIMAFILRDRELAQISQFQDTALSRKVASELPDFDLKALAEGLGVAFLRLESDEEVEEVVARARAHEAQGRSVLVEVAIDYSRKTYFTRGVVKTNLLRLPMKDRLRVVGRALIRRVTG